jgi:hypothetical protein
MVHRQSRCPMPKNDKSDLNREPEGEADRVFAATLRNLVNTPPKPHAPLNPPKAQRKANKV